MTATPASADGASPPVTFSFSLGFTGAPAVGDAAGVAPLYQCAESKIYGCDFYGSPAVCKHRFPKRYRHATLDAKLREQRTMREARALVRCRKSGIRVPAVYAVDKRTCKIFMERIPGSTVKAALDAAYADIKRAALADGHTAVVRQLLGGIGEMVALLHNAGVIHGDLTTSNFMTMAAADANGRIRDCDANNKSSSSSSSSDRDGLVVIDLGLVGDRASAEERAVDLYVLERAIASTHPFVESFASQVILEGYTRVADVKKGQDTIARLELVRARGRKRSMIG